MCYWVWLRFMVYSVVYLTTCVARGVFVHIYTAFWAVVVIRGFTLAVTRWRKRMVWTQPSCLTLQMIYVYVFRKNITIMFVSTNIFKYWIVRFSLIPTLTSFVWGPTLDHFRMLPMEIPRVQKTCVCDYPRTIGP